MLKNNQYVLKNGGNVFKSQSIFSYLESNNFYQLYMFLTTSGLTQTSPFNIYWSKPTTMSKFKYTSDVNELTINLGTTNESSWKKIYTFGNCDAVRFIGTGGYTGSNHYVRGDMQSFLNQFPNLEKFYITKGTFNTNLNYLNLPINLKFFYLDDTTVSGNINTWQNIKKLEELHLIGTPFTGNLNNLNLTNVKTLHLNVLNNLNCNLNTFFDNNTGMSYLDLNACALLSGNTTTLDVSNLTYINLGVTTSPNFTGSITNWTFNNNLTYFYLNYRYNTGDITNWDIGSTKITYFSISYYTYSINNNNIYGDMSNWVLPNTLYNFILYANSGITAIPTNFSNTNLGNIYISYCNGLISVSGCTFPQSLTDLKIIYNSALSDDINDLNINVNNMYLYNNSLKGNIDEYTIPSASTNLSLNNNKITGYFSGLTYNTKVSQLLLYNNLMSGNIVGSVFPQSLSTLNIANNPNLYIDFSAGVLNLSGISTVDFSNISGITGDLSNLIIPNTMSQLTISNSNFNCDLSKLNPYKVTYSLIVNAISNGKLYGDITNWLTGATYNSIYLYINGNPNLSGDTTNWKITGVTYFTCSDTALSGRLKHGNVYYLQTYNSLISSDIGADFNFSNRMYDVRMYNCNLYGSLSAVTLFNNFNNFDIHNNTGITGINELVDYAFINRKNFINSYTKIFNMTNIGDTVTGTTEVLGDIGTYVGNAWDLTEEQVNNLHAGTDYNGAGTNILWTSKEKIYWMKNARVSSTNNNRRYAVFYFYYT
jgi:hypothetical protein